MERVLVTGAAGILGLEIASAMASDFHIRLFDETKPDVGAGGGGEWRQGSLVDETAIRGAVRDIDVVIHTGDPPLNLPISERDETLLDLATRGTHKLYTAAVEAGVKRFVYGGTLEIFADYPDTVYVSEFHRPLPTPEVYSMTRYLGEVTSREFARDFRITVTTLRLGKMVYEEDVAGQDRDLMWLDWRDAASTFRVAASLDRSDEIEWSGLVFPGRYNLYHVCAPADNAKYLCGKSSSLFAPQHTFGWEGGGG